MISRTLFNKWTIVAFILFTASTLLCFSSYRTGVQVQYARSNYLVGFTSTTGYFWSYFGTRYILNPADEGLVLRLSDPPARPADRIGSWDDVYIEDSVWGARYHCFVLDTRKVSLLLLLLLMRRPLLYAEASLLTVSRQSQVPLCATCGYNLTANISGVCPECGTAIVCRTEADR